MAEQEIEINCEDCTDNVLRPAWYANEQNVFFRWSMKYCDSCRRKRELEALKSLGKIVEALANDKPSVATDA